MLKEPEQGYGRDHHENITESGQELLHGHEEQELQRYLDAVNQDMYRKKQAIAVVMLIVIGAGVLWTAISVLKELL